MHSRYARILLTGILFVGLAHGQEQPPAALNEPLRTLTAYERGDSRAPLVKLERLAGQAHGDGALRAALEQGLLEALEAGPSPAAREFICKQLSRIGTDASVPALSSLLENPLAAHMARYALERIGGPEAIAALAGALPTAEGDHRVGLIHSLGRLRAASAVESLGGLLGVADPATVSAAASALGRIGGTQAESLLAAEMAAEPSAALAEAVLICAARRLQQGDEDKARELAAVVLGARPPAVYRGAALRIQVLAADAPMEELAERLVRERPEVSRRLVPLLRDASAHGGVQPLLERLKDMPPQILPGVFMALGDAKAPAAESLLRRWLADAAYDAEVRAAAAWALGRRGGAESVGALARAAAGEPREVAEAARKALVYASGPKVNNAILGKLKRGPAPIRRELATIAARRGMSSAMPVLLDSLDAQGLQDASRQALVALARPDDIPRLLEALNREPSPEARAALEEALIAAARWRPGAAAKLLEAMDRLEASAARTGVIRALGQTRPPEALPILAGEAKEGRGEGREAALAALAAWPSAEAGVHLVEMLELRPADREAVVTGLAQLVSDPNAGSSEHRLELAKQSLNAVNSVEPTRRLLAALPGLGTLEALPLAEAYVDHPQLAETAEAALTDIRRSAWRASASHMTEIAENAIDRDPSSRWHTGAQQEGGEWFQLDLGAPYTVSGIALTLGEQAREGYPREYEVYLSLDGSDWGRPAAQGAGAAGTMSIEVAPRQARYVRIVQTGRGDGVFWAIDEIEVAAD